MAHVRGRVIPVLLTLSLLTVAGCGRSPAQHPAPAPAVVGGALFRLPDIALPAGSEVPPAATPAPDGLIATAAVPKIGLYDDPTAAAPAGTMGNPTALGVPLVFRVREQQGSDWLRVQVPERPNERTAWVRRSDVSLHTTTFHLRVEVSAHRLVAFDGSSQVFETAVATGAASAPTPTGDYYIDGSFKLANPNGPYGAYALSVAAFSDVFKSFSGGPGQIALHGTNQPALIGTPASHGCVRMTNDAITRLVQMVPVGTPVEIVA